MRYIGLLFKNKFFVVKRDVEVFNCEFGKVELKNVKEGDVVETHLGYKATVFSPTFVDVMLKKMRRKPQIITPVDASVIVAKSGIEKGKSIVIDAGSGSGALALFLSRFAKHVYTYEKREEFARIVEENIKLLNVKNVTLKLRDVAEQGFDEENVDLVTLDLESPERVVKHAYKSLKPGGWLVVFCPYAEEVGAVVKEMLDRFAEIEVVENCLRRWQVSFDKKGRSHLRALPFVNFTGFMVFGRKVLT
jgi:tRNA (adenine57-N1/adenine58-N1)-methyltransferase